MREREKERGCQRGRERGSKIERMEFKKPGGLGVGANLCAGRLGGRVRQGERGKSDRVREKENEERMRRYDCRFGKSLSQQTAVHSALL